MTKRIYVNLEVDLAEGANPESAAEALFDYACNIDEPMIFSINGYDFNVPHD